ASVFSTSNEKLTPPVYQEKIHAPPTRQITYTSHTLKAIVKALPPFSFFVFVVANPMASKISVQNVKMSRDFSSANSHFGESSDITAARFVAIGLSRSTVPYGFKYSTSRNRMLLTKPVNPACAVIANEVPKSVFAPPNRLNAPHITTPT